MDSPLWTLAELVNTAAIVASAQLYLHRRLGTQGRQTLRLALGGLVVISLLMGCQLLSVHDSIRIPVLAVFCVLYGLHVAGGTRSQRVFHALLAFSLAGLSDVVVFSVLTFLPGVTFPMLLDQTEYRLIAMVASKLILVPLAIAYSRRREDENDSGLHLAYVAFVPLMSMAMLTVLIQYETSLNGHGSLGLLLLSLGLFVMNLVLLALHGRLAARATELHEKQHMLEKSEQQNRYFQEILAASDSLQGFRHDLKNHLQVLGGFLQMGKQERAMEYLGEIGSFVNRSDVIVDTGVPLVDAVVGCKVALAKSQGVDIRHAIRLEKDIPIQALDLCSLLGNTLDNALEACARIEGGERRYIRLELTAEDGAVNLAVINSIKPVAGQANLKSGKPGGGHGIGLSVVRKAVQKYNGSMEILQDGHEFNVQIKLPAPQPTPTQPGTL